MADSDDEFDRRNVRDKFRHERSDYEKRDERKARDPWQDRSVAARSSRDRRDGYYDRRSSPKRDSSPPVAKRVRREVDDGSGQQFRVPYGSGPLPGGHLPAHGWGPSGGSGDMHPPFQQGSQPADSDVQTQPPMMNMKQFLASQDENITDTEAKKRYAEYQADFKRQQINEFFNQHKDEEWFRSKYHPEEYDKKQEEARSILKHRCSVFMKLLSMGRLKNAVVDIDHSAELVRILDAAVIFMEGGSEFDLVAMEDDKAAEAVKKPNAEPDSKKSTATEETATDTAAAGDDDKDSEKSSDDEDHPKFTEPLKLGSSTTAVSTKAASSNDSSSATVQIDSIAESKKLPKIKKDDSFDSGSVSSSSSDSEDENEPVPTDVKLPEATSPDAVSSTSNVNGEPVVVESKPKPLHKTLSIFLRNLAPTITQQEVEGVCKQYPGFLRVALQDPQPERKFQRRGWVTFKYDVNVKEICYNLNQIRLRECDMGAIVNRDLQQRIRPVSGLTGHQQIAKSDIKNAAKIIQNFDNRWNIWDDIKDNDKPTFGFVSKNPIMKNITDYLVDEGSYEEDVLLGEDPDVKKDLNSEVAFEQDKELLSVLDRMILYLRIVYSFDYYSTVEYPHEDAMPHRCGIVHARGSTPRGKVTQQDLNEWLSSFETRILPFVNLKLTLDDAEIIKLGKKTYDECTELEKFILANTQELGKDKWLCPLSGKKFKGPEFVRKHIMTKHLEKLEELKKDVTYFNTYLMDARRPQLPEHPVTRMLTNPPPPRESFLPAAPPGYHGPAPPPVMAYRPPIIHQGAPVMYNHPPPFPRRDHYRNNDYRPPASEPPPRPPVRRDRSRTDPRQVISYTDLDAPPEVD